MLLGVDSGSAIDEFGNFHFFAFLDAFEVRNMGFIPKFLSFLGDQQGLKVRVYVFFGCTFHFTLEPFPGVAVNVLGLCLHTYIYVAGTGRIFGFMVFRNRVAVHFPIFKSIVF